MTIKIKALSDKAVMPTYGSKGAACFDLYATHGGIVPARGSAMFSTDLAFEIPEGYVMKVYSRSSQGFKYGISLVNGTGIIDSDYVGHVMIKLQSASDTDYCVLEGDRIAQAMIQPVEQYDFEWVSELKDTERGEGGLGSTGR